MDEFTVIGVISETIRELLQKELHDSFSNDFNKGNEVVLISPKDMGTTDRLSLYLYHIVENPYMKNQPMERIGENQLKYAPLSLNLYYLLTPKSTEDTGDIKGWDAHAILGRAMQVLYDHSILEGPDLKGLLEAPANDYVDFYDKIGQVRIILNSLSLDDLTKIWGALDTPLMLSASYEVRVIMIESERKKEFTRIEEMSKGFFQTKGNEGKS